MEDDVQRSGRRSAAERALRGAASPFVGYFDRRFQDLHDHLDRDAPQLDQLSADLRRELSRTRADVAADTDTIAELAFTLERFADLFTMRMEELARNLAVSAGSRGSEIGSSVVELPFAFAAAAVLERGATVATVNDDGRLSIGLASLGLDVTAVEPDARVGHPDVTVVHEHVADWGGPAEPLDAVFALTAASGPRASDARPAPESGDLFRKWLRPSGLLVLATPVGPGHGIDGDGVAALLADWDVERQQRFEQDAGGAWRPSDDPSRIGVVLVRATPRP